MTVILEAPLDRVSMQARPYPADMLAGCNTGLLLFAAAFCGVNDAIHFARREMVCTCVDTDQDKLGRMAALYPPEWVFYSGDAWEFAQAAAEAGNGWDAVSADTFTGDATDRSLKTLDLWCSVAYKCVTATIAYGQDYTVPDGWRASLFPRSDLAAWLVLRRD